MVRATPTACETAEIFNRRFSWGKNDIRASQGLRFARLTKSRWWRAATLFVSDLLALGLAWALSFFVNQFYSPVPDALIWWRWWGVPSLAWIFTAAILILFAQSGLYSCARTGRDYLKAGQLVTSVFLFSLVLSYFFDPTLDPPRSLFFSAWFGSVVLVVTLRIAATLIYDRLVEEPVVPTFAIAPEARLEKLAQTLETRSRYRIVGTATSERANLASTRQAILTSGAREVFAAELPNTELASALYWQLRAAGITLRLLPSSCEALHRRGVPEVVAGLPTLRVEAPWLLDWDYRIKRWIDIFGALFGLILLSPLLVGIAIAIKSTSPGAIFFRQERMGLQGRKFKMWKFRTMVENAEALQVQLEQFNRAADGVTFKMQDDPRITKIGHFLRRTSLDELPQLFNVLMGHMSLVGPRPLPMRDIERCEEWHHTRHQVLPGMTGLWQVSGRADITDFDDATRLDLYYIDNWSLKLDLDILVETIRIVLFGEGAY